jgi:hypothetical protein
MAERTAAEYAISLRLTLTAGIDNPAVTLIMCVLYTHGACLMSGTSLQARRRTGTFRLGSGINVSVVDA